MKRFSWGEETRLKNVAEAWGTSFFRLNGAQRIERVTSMLREDGHRVVTVSSRLRLDGVKAVGVVTDSGLYCFPSGRFGLSRNIIAAGFEEFSIALLPPESSHEESISLHDLAEKLHLPSKYYLTRLNYELSWPRSDDVLWLQICRHRNAIYPENPRDMLPGERHHLRARDRHEIKMFSDVLIHALATFAQRTEQVVEVEVEERQRPPKDSIPMASEGPLRACSDCGRRVVNCSHLQDMWCNQCRTYTTKPGLHQNCIPGQWK